MDLSADFLYPYNAKKNFGRHNLRPKNRDCYGGSTVGTLNYSIP